jgi:hypothetical protein
MDLRKIKIKIKIKIIKALIDFINKASRSNFIILTGAYTHRNSQHLGVYKQF